jgi:hypothetical protein
MTLKVVIDGLFNKAITDYSYLKVPANEISKFENKEELIIENQDIDMILDD